MARVIETLAGFTRHRQLPRWRRDFYNPGAENSIQGPEVILFADF